MDEIWRVHFLHADLRAAGQSSFVALEKPSQGDFPSKAATQGSSHYESWISNSESGEVLCSKPTLLGHVSQNLSLPGPSAPLWSFLPRMIHTAGTTMRWEPCAYTTGPPPPCCAVCLSHTHRHTYSKRLSSTYKELNFSQWELWPYLERPADLFVLAVGLSNKWSLSRRKPRQIRCINLQHCWTTAQAKTLKHGAQAQHLRVTVCNPIQMCPDVYTMPFFPPPRVAWEAQMLHSWSVLGEKTEETPRENGQLRQKPCLFSLNSVAFTNSSIAPGYFRAFPTHSYFLTQRVSFPSCCFREKKTFASSIIQKWGGCSLMLSSLMSSIPSKWKTLSSTLCGTPSIHNLLMLMDGHACSGPL